MNNAFWVPAKQLQRIPPRKEHHRMAASALPLQTCTNIARDREAGSATMTVLTVLAHLPMGVDDGNPQARLTHALNASIIRVSTAGAGARREEARRNAARAEDNGSSTPPQPPSSSFAPCAGPYGSGRGRLSLRARARVAPAPAWAGARGMPRKITRRPPLACTRALHFGSAGRDAEPAQVTVAGDPRGADGKDVSRSYRAGKPAGSPR